MSESKPQPATPILLSFESPNALARAAAESWLKSTNSKPTQFVAVSGGRIARTFFEAVTRKAKEQSTRLSGIHFFWADERCVPREHPESNFGLARQWLLEPLQIPPEHIHRIRGEIAPVDAARAAGEELRRWAPLNEAGQPVLD